jgi:hypothetical protein
MNRRHFRAATMCLDGDTHHLASTYQFTDTVHVHCSNQDTINLSGCWSLYTWGSTDSSGCANYFTLNQWGTSLDGYGQYRCNSASVWGSVSTLTDSAFISLRLNGMRDSLILRGMLYGSDVASGYFASSRDTTVVLGGWQITRSAYCDSMQPPPPPPPAGCDTFVISDTICQDTVTLIRQAAKVCAQYGTSLNWYQLLDYCDRDLRSGIRFAVCADSMVPPPSCDTIPIEGNGTCRSDSAWVRTARAQVEAAGRLFGGIIPIEMCTPNPRTGQARYRSVCALSCPRGLD